MITEIKSSKLNVVVAISIRAALLTALTFAIAQSSTFAQEAQAKQVQPPPQAAEVRVNGQVLSAAQIAELQRIYRVKPQPGNYWYDSLSGLYGMVGGPAWGLMCPGHKLGTLAEDASAGDTPVFVNHRRIPCAEWLVWSGIVGAPVRPGRYWLDATGNVGYEGISVPILNLHKVAARSGQSRGANSPHKSVLSTWDRTGGAVFGNADVLTSGGSWHRGQ